MTKPLKLDHRAHRRLWAQHWTPERPSCSFKLACNHSEVALYVFGSLIQQKLALLGQRHLDVKGVGVTQRRHSRLVAERPLCDALRAPRSFLPAPNNSWYPWSAHPSY